MKTPNTETSQADLREVVLEIFQQLAELKREKPARSFYTPPEIARLLSVRRDTVLRWIRTGELDAVDISRDPAHRRYRISPEAFAAFCSLRRAARPRRR